MRCSKLYYVCNFELADMFGNEAIEHIQHHRKPLKLLFL